MLCCVDAIDNFFLMLTNFLQFRRLTRVSDDRLKSSVIHYFHYRQPVSRGLLDLDLYFVALNEKHFQLLSYEPVPY